MKLIFPPEIVVWGETRLVRFAPNNVGGVLPHLQ